MKRESIRSYLKPYSISDQRKTTIAHAFASAIAPNDDYDDQLIIQALLDIGQNPDSDLVCVYCEERPAETWDHVFGLVKNREYAGYGHTIGNLLPICKECNSSKGNKNWRDFIQTKIKDEDRLAIKVSQLENYFMKYLGTRFDNKAIAEQCPNEMHGLLEIREQILILMKSADEIAGKIRVKVKESGIISKP